MLPRRRPTTLRACGVLDTRNWICKWRRAGWKAARRGQREEGGPLSIVYALFSRPETIGTADILCLRLRIEPLIIRRWHQWQVFEKKNRKRGTKFFSLMRTENCSRGLLATTSPAWSRRLWGTTWLTQELSLRVNARGKRLSMLALLVV